MIMERGVAGVSTRDLAQRVGVSEALIFHYFKSKAGLLEAAALSRETLLSSLLEVLEKPASNNLAATLQSLTEAASKRLRPGTPGWAFCSIMLSRDPRTQDFRETGLSVLTNARSRFADWLEDSGRLRTDGFAAACSFFEGVLFLVATLPSEAQAWDESAPEAFAGLALRWCQIHLGDA